MVLSSGLAESSVSDFNLRSNSSVSLFYALIRSQIEFQSHTLILDLGLSQR